MSSHISNQNKQQNIFICASSTIAVSTLTGIGMGVTPVMGAVAGTVALMVTALFNANIKNFCNKMKKDYNCCISKTIYNSIDLIKLYVASHLSCAIVTRCALGALSLPYAFIIGSIGIYLGIPLGSSICSYFLPHAKKFDISSVKNGDRSLANGWGSKPRAVN